MYTRVRSCSRVRSFPGESERSNVDENPMNSDESSIVDLEKLDLTGNDDEPELSVERTYLVVSPELDTKRSRKRSVNPGESSPIVRTDSRASSNAEKSARNYIALKTTDDMFKGGVEQSNPLGEDKPIESPSFSSSSSSSSPHSAFENSLFSLRSYKTKNTGPESKIIETARDTGKMFQPEISMRPKRMFGRRLTQIIHEDPPGHANFSSVFPASLTDNILYSTTLTHRYSSFTSESFSDIWVPTHKENKHDQNNFQQVFDVISEGRNTSSTTVNSLVTTTARSCDTTLSLHNSSSMKETHNNTRIRRNAGSFSRDNSPKPRRDRAQHDGVRESGEGHKRMTVDAGGTDAHRRKLTVLLAADNIEDESQIDLAVHGELAGKIVERIFEEVQRNEGLKVALGPGLYRKHKPQESIALDKMYRQGLDEEEVKETETMMKRVMELLGRLVLDEVRRKTCASLAPDMHDFLQWSLGLEELAEPSSDQVPPLPMIPENRLHEATERPPPSADKYLFENSPNGQSSGSKDLSELERKVELLKSLIKEYRALTEREKTKVQTVHDYLVRQLGLLMKYIESKEASSPKRISDNTETAGAGLSPGKENILQYQGSMPNRDSKKSREIGSNATNEETNGGSDNRPTFGTTSSISPYFNDNSRAVKRLWRERRKDEDDSAEIGRARRAKNRNDGNYEPEESLEYRKLYRRIATLKRKKRDDSWGYEVPRIYVGPMKLSEVSVSTIADLDRPVTRFSMFDHIVDSSTPVRGKNRAEDEVLLLNKREAWRKENERSLEEVAFGVDIRNDSTTVREQLMSYDLDSESRIKRQFDFEISSIRETTTNSTAIDHENSNRGDEMRNLGTVEKKINVFPVNVDSAKKIE